VHDILRGEARRALRELFRVGEVRPNRATQFVQQRGLQSQMRKLRRSGSCLGQLQCRCLQRFIEFARLAGQ
jgi:hypothetical protein